MSSIFDDVPFEWRVEGASVVFDTYGAVVGDIIFTFKLYGSQTCDCLKAGVRLSRTPERLVSST